MPLVLPFASVLRTLSRDMISDAGVSQEGLKSILFRREILQDGWPIILIAVHFSPSNSNLFFPLARTERRVAEGHQSRSGRTG